MKRICVFCGSNAGDQPVHAQAARALGVEIVRHGLGLVYGGGRVGLMGLLADAVLKQGGEVLGVIPQGLVDKELAHTSLTELRVVHSMHQRKALMADLADGFLAMPGGYGTLEELCEVLTWSQLGLHRKPCGLLNVEGFYDPFLAQIDRAITAGFIAPEQRSLIVLGQDPGELIDRLFRVHLPPLRQWIDQDET